MEENKKVNLKFLQNELVLCYDPDPIKARMLYDAKVLDNDVTKDDKGKKVSEYYVHFQGWNKSWDRWVLEDQLLRNNESSRALQQKLYQEAIKPKKSKQKSSRSEHIEDDKSIASTGSGEGDEDIKSSELAKVVLSLPKVLANRLEDDCYSIKRKKKLIRLPRKPCVKDIFKKYFHHCQTESESGVSKNQSLQIVEELLEGLNVYFNFYLGTLLLYNFEREQYHSIFSPKKTNTNDNKNIKDVLSPASTSNSSSTESTTASFNTDSCQQSNTSNEPPWRLSLGVSDRQLRRPKRNINENKNFAEVIDNGKCLKSGSSIDLNELHPQPALCSRETRSHCKKLTNNDIKIKEELDCDIQPRNGDNMTNIVTRPSLTDTGARLRRSARSSSRKKSDDTGDCAESGVKRNKSVDTEVGVDNDKRNKSIDTQDADYALPIGSTAQSLQATQNRKVKLQPIILGPPILGPPDLGPLIAEEQVKLSHEVRSFVLFPQTVEAETPSDIYGPEHLLRLFVKLPILLAASNIEEEKIKVIINHVTFFLEYLSECNELFVESVYTESII